ncbi:FAD-dependent oxidoreductase [Microbispora sp. RL4-1S]|uniref:FAD-dependent oxidoreductase n=1 Tax=Microbispora oryzae TaxID=2806554 RepID=A0A940WGF6_9ACTN|nr:FAD-dependent oxidoreductase [Microbispora oryzae]MBP2705065.1 FAD-dependent oxidoreductase [Microbispora oryzae]
MTPHLSAAPPELEGKIVTPVDPRYLLLRSTHTGVAEPALVLLPESTTEVVAALRFARDRDLPVTVRSGGHGVSGHATHDGGVVIDLSALNRVEVLDRRKRLVRVQAGARWAAVGQSLAPYGLAIGSDDHGDLGVGGLATGGGIGWLVRDYGLTIDRIRAADVVLADGTIARADAEHDPDMLWAVRGAGAGVGIVVEFEIEAMEVCDVGYVQIAVEIKRDGRALRQWADHMASATRGLTTTVSVQSCGSALVASITAVVAGTDRHHLRAAVEPLLLIGTRLLDLNVRLTPYHALLATPHLYPGSGQQAGATTNGLLRAMTDDDATAIMAAATMPQQPSIQLRSVGGAVNDVPAGATAYPHRHQDTLVIASVFPPRRGAELDAVWQPLAGRSDGAYGGFESRPGPDAFARIYPGATGQRVTRLWNRYDPDGVFRRKEPGRGRG